MDKHHFSFYITEMLRLHPDWLSTAIEGLQAGAVAANKTLSAQCMLAEMAVMHALTLADPKRLNSDTRNLVNIKLCEYLRIIEGSAPIEEEAHQRLSAEIAKCHNKEIEKLNKEVLNEKQ